MTDTQAFGADDQTLIEQLTSHPDPLVRALVARFEELAAEKSPELAYERGFGDGYAECLNHEDDF